MADAITAVMEARDSSSLVNSLQHLNEVLFGIIQRLQHEISQLDASQPTENPALPKSFGRENLERLVSSKLN